MAIINKSRQYVYYLSDRTGKTAEAIGQSLLSQFSAYEFVSKSYSFIDSEVKVNDICNELNNICLSTKIQPIVFNTIVNTNHQKMISRTNSCVIDLFGEFILPLEKHFKTTSSHASGVTHEKFDVDAYQARIDAIDFTLSYDDGVRYEHYDRADIVLIGVSRSGKSPTCIYLAMNFSIKAANYPLSEEQLEICKLPDSLIDNLDKIVGLSLTARQLYEMRQKRRPNSKYAEYDTCLRDIRLAENLFNHYQIPFIESTSTSIEEISVNLLKLKKLIK
jgi:regulator of PEP synthase PpsR (kinase-PPPase family)